MAKKGGGTRLSRHRSHRHQQQFLGRRGAQRGEDRGRARCATCASRRSRSSTSRSRTARWCSSARGSRCRSSTTPNGMFTAVVRITGAGRLDDFRERLRWLMVRDEDAEDYTEHHARGRRSSTASRPRRGIPFPAFTAASADFPELRVEAEWERDGERGRAVIENGQLVEQTSGRSTARRSTFASATKAASSSAWPAWRSRDGSLIGYAVDRRRATPTGATATAARAARHRGARRGARGGRVPLRRGVDLVRRGGGGARARALCQLRLPGARREPEVGEARAAARERRRYSSLDAARRQAAREAIVAQWLKR